MDELLTEREFQIVELICDGKNDKMIAGELFISMNTLKTHKNSIYQKLEVNSRIQVLCKLFKMGLIELKGIQIVLSKKIHQI